MKKVLIGKVYANWCGHCQSLKPEWEKMKKDLTSKMKKMKKYSIEFVEIEEQEQDKLAEFKERFPNLSVNGYPTIFKSYGNGLEYYQGERRADKMGNWLIIQKHTRTMGGNKSKRGRNKKTKNKKTLKRR